jgi:cbb3-type cytochrome oxidase subunit 3
LLLLFLTVGAIAFTLAKRNNIALAEYVGTVANFVLLAPLLVDLAGLPKDIGLVAMLLFFGGMTLILAVSALFSISTLQLFSR